jgi:N-acetylneuraminic acid mutarotase
MSVEVNMKTISQTILLFLMTPVMLKSTLCNSGEKILRKFWLIIISLVIISIQIQAQNGWTRKKDIPAARTTSCAVVVNNKIYVLGGALDASLTDANDNQVYDPSTDRWEKKKPMQYARCFPFAAVVNDTIYVIGGSYNNPSSIIESYDPVTDTWTRKANMLAPRFGASACVVNGIIYINCTPSLGQIFYII